MSTILPKSISRAIRRSVSSLSESAQTLSVRALNSAPEHLSPSESVNISRGHPARVSSRRVHANTFLLLGNREQGIITAENMKKRIKHLLSLTTEAKLCIKDCDESTETDFEEEFVSAKMAVDSASIAYSELLEELALTDEGIPLLNEIRKMYAPSVEDLRTELKALMKMKAM